MKSYEEMAENVLHKISEHKKRKRLQLKVLTIVFNICVIGVIAAEVFLVKNTVTSVGNYEVVSDDYFEIKKITMVYDGIYCGEFAGDMYRPEGYSSYIGSALALKMSITEDEDYKYSVLLRKPGAANITDEEIKKLSRENEISLENIYCVEINENDGSIGICYYALLNKNQIMALANKKIICNYIGNGDVNRIKTDWDNKEFIDNYCEYWGDMLVFDNGKIIQRW